MLVGWWVGGFVGWLAGLAGWFPFFVFLVDE